MMRAIVASAVALMVPALAMAEPHGDRPHGAAMHGASMQGSSTHGAPPVMSTGMTEAPSMESDGPAMGDIDDRGMSMPSDPGAYQRPTYGYTLPRGWVAPSYYLDDYHEYGLPVPAAGFGWSRYYDDAVLTDRWGRVYDARPDFARHHDRRGYRGRYPGNRRPHWDIGYFEGRGPSYGYATVGYATGCDCGETVTTTTRTTTPATTRTVRYETVREAEPRRVVRRQARGKYVPLAR